MQMAAFTVLAYYLASSLESYAAGLTLPDQYTARNLTSALRTIVVAAAYLATFLLGANTIGLAGMHGVVCGAPPCDRCTGLTLKIAVYGDQDDTPQRAARPKDTLPKVRITDDVDTVRAAFDALEREALQKAKQRNADKS